MWKRVKIPHPPVLLRDQLFCELEAFGLPIIVEAGFRPFKLILPSWVQSWLRGNSGPGGRRLFLLDEIRLLRPLGDFFIRDALAGPGWIPPGKSLLHLFLRELFRGCGGKRYAALSWSAGLAAENFLRAIFGSSAAGQKSAAFEASWLAAHDRICMLPAIEAAMACSARLEEAACGLLRFRTEDSPEAIMELVGSMWRLGWRPAGGTGNRPAKLTCNPAEFGGTTHEKAIALAMHQGPEGLLGKLDRLPDLAAKSRCRQAIGLQANLNRLTG